MMFKQYRTKLILFILALAVQLGVFFYLLFYHEFFWINGLLMGTLFYTILKMIKYVDQINSELTKLFEAIRYSDFSISFPGKVRGSGFDELYDALRFVIDEFKEERKQRVEHYNYMKTIVQHVKVGLIAFNDQGNIELMNLAFKKMFSIRKFKNIKQLNENYPELLVLLLKVKPFEKENVTVQINGDPMNLAVSATEFVLKQQNYKLLSIHDINSELEKKEMEAWEKLISVITHEIMNSITPISSLSSTINTTLSSAGNDRNNLSHEDIEDLSLAANTIEKRSDGLLKFVEKYRQVTRIPKPELAEVTVQRIFTEILPVIEKDPNFQSINFTYQVKPQELVLNADAAMVQQVLINLLKNAIEALKETEQPMLMMSARVNDNGKVLIEITDNGPGVSEANLQKVFVPFFSTKKQGSGIGLSLSRQIMRAHDGRLLVSSVPKVKTVFTMEF